MYTWLLGAFVDLRADFSSSNPVNECCGLIAGNTLASILARSDVNAICVHRITVDCLGFAEIDFLVAVLTLPPR